MGSTNLGSIYATSIASENYIIIDTQNIELSGNLNMTNNVIISNGLLNCNSINPNASNSFSLGTSLNRWNNAYINDISARNISVSGNIIPFINLSGSLGSSTNIWSNAYIRDLSVANISVSGNINVSGNLIPLNSISSDLGTSSNYWRSAYIQDISARNISVSGNIIPFVNLSGSLGTSSNIWSNAYISDLSGINSINGATWPLTSGGTGGGTSDFSGTDISTSLIPRTTNSVDLGSYTSYWRNAYINNIFAGNIYTKTEVDSSLLTALNTNHYTKQYANNLWNQIGANLSFSTTNAIFGISNNGRVVGLTEPAFNSNIGRLYVYEISFNGTSYSWETLGLSSEIMVGQTSTDLFGGTGNSKLAFSSDGRIVAVSSTLNDTCGNNTGQISVFELSANVWRLRGQPINGKPLTNYQLGFNVALSGNGNILAAASRNYNEILAYEFIDNSWIQRGQDISGSTYTDQAGYIAVGGYVLGWACALSLDGTTIIAGQGAMNNDSIYYAGRVNIYRYNNTTRLWDNIGIINGIYNLQYFGWHVSISSDGNTIAVGSRYRDGVSNPFILQDCGSIIVYKYNDGTSWTQIGETIFGTAINDSIVGVWVSISNDGTIISFSTNISIKVFKLYANTWYQIGQSINRIWDFPGGQLLRCVLSGDGTTFIHQQYVSDTNNRCSVYGMDKLLAFNDLFASSLTINSNIVPFVNNISSLGTTTIKWYEVFTTFITVNGTRTGSDDRLKHNEININNGLIVIDQLCPKFYQKTIEMLDAHYYGDLSGITWNYEAGLIAQELLQISDLSFVVSGGDTYDSSNNVKPETYYVNYNSIFVYGLAAIKELHQKVKVQETSILSLQTSLLEQQSIINSLMTRIEALENKP
jgi:hypothetical protein